MFKRVLVAAFAAAVMGGAVAPPANAAYAEIHFFDGLMALGGEDTTAAGPGPNQVAKNRQYKDVYWVAGSPAACMSTDAYYTNGTNDLGSGSCDGSFESSANPFLLSTIKCRYYSNSAGYPSYRSTDCYADYLL